MDLCRRRRKRGQSVMKGSEQVFTAILLLEAVRVLEKNKKLFE